MSWYILLEFAMMFIAPIPGIIIAGIYEKKGVPSKALVTFTQPNGQRAQLQTDVLWSWTVYIFKSWALLFRGQFLEFIVVFFLVDGLLLQGGMTTIVNWPASNDAGTIIWSSNVGNIIFGVVLLLLYSAAMSYYVAFANRNRLRSWNNRGFDLSQTPNLDKLYAYLKIIPRTNPKDLASNQRSGQTHDYVVPDKQVEEVDEDDYSNLTINDLKLLLRTEGIPFPSSANKQQLLELVDEYIVKKDNVKKK